MRELPFLANERTVKAILDGTQTQDRRPINPQPHLGSDSLGGQRWYWQWKKGHRPNWPELSGFLGILKHYAPWQPGDHLYVRETWAPALTKHDYTGNPDDHGGPNDPCVAYRATMTYTCGAVVPDIPRKWHANIHMPKRYARILLEVLSVRVERVQEITTEDAIAEGIQRDPQWTPRVQFARLWDSMYAKKDCGWSVNPWVWVTEFRRMENEKHEL